MLRLYMDEDSMGHAIVRALRTAGIDVLTALEAAMIERLDPDHLAFAASGGRVLCTFNIGDFAALHATYLAEGRQHAGILRVHQQRYSTGELIHRLLRFTSALTANEMVNRAEYLSAWEPAE